MQKIIVKSVEQKQSQKDPTKSYYVLTDDKDTKMSSFDKAVLSLATGDLIDAELIVQGNYTNLKSFTIISQPSKPPPKPEPEKRKEYTQPPYYDETRASIESQVAAKIASDLLCAKIIEREEVLGRAVIEWCKKRLPVNLANVKQALEDTKVLYGDASESKSKPVQQKTNTGIKKES